jgi:hypothetical protein
MGHDPGVSGSTYRRGTYMVGAYRSGTGEAEAIGFRDKKILGSYSTTSNSGHSTMYTLCLTCAILTRFGTVRRASDFAHCLC